MILLAAVVCVPGLAPADVHMERQMLQGLLMEAPTVAAEAAR